MSCPICDKKRANCDCSSTAIRLHEENNELSCKLDKATERIQYLESRMKQYEAAYQAAMKDDTADKYRQRAEAAELQVESLAEMLRRAEDALGPDRTPTDRREALMVIGKALVSKKKIDPAANFRPHSCNGPESGCLICKKIADHGLTGE